MKLIIRLLLIGLWLPAGLPAARAQLTVQLQVLPPNSPYLSDYTSQPNRMVLIITNVSSQTQRLYFTGQVTGDNGVSARTKDGYKPSQPVQIGPNTTQQLTGAQLSPLFNWDMGTLQGVNVRQVERSGLLPQGSYRICVDVRDYNTGNIVGAVQPSACSQPFSVVFPPPPVITAPACNTTLPQAQGASVIFSWTIPSGVPPQRLQYRLKIVEVVPADRPLQDALLSATTPPLIDITTTNNTYLLQLALLTPAHQAGTGRYVFSVTAGDKLNEILFANNGESEACGFNTEAQQNCPKCDCSVTGSIKPNERKGSTLDFTAEVKPECKGLFGVPPCKPCSVVSVTYKWSVSGEPGVGEIDGPDAGAGAKVKFRKAGDYVVNLTTTLTCSDGTRCTYHTSYEDTEHPPTIALDPCSCDASCTIEKTPPPGDGFKAMVKAKCGGGCSVVSTTYEWLITGSDTGVAAIAGKANGPAVAVKRKKGGPYNVSVSGIVTCSDGKKCPFYCDREETGEPPPTTHECRIGYEWCAATGIKVKVGSLKYYPDRKDLLQDMRPGELIGLSVLGEDKDVLIQKCICPGDTSRTAHSPVADEVTYQWEISGLKEGSGKLLNAEGNSTIYQLPWCFEKYPVKDKVVVRLKNKGGKADDDETIVTFTITLDLDGSKINKDWMIGQNYAIPLWTIAATITPAIEKMGRNVACKEVQACCEPVLLDNWKFRFGLNLYGSLQKMAAMEFPDNMVLLKANAWNDDDLLLTCRDQLTGVPVEKRLRMVPDVMDYTWTVVSGPGTLLYDKGPQVVLIHQYNTETPVIVKCEITDSRTQFKDMPPISFTRTVDPRKRPLAVVAVGNTHLADYPLAPEPLVDLAKLAADNYTAAGYDGWNWGYKDLPGITKAFQDPRIQAVMIISHGVNGAMKMNDEDGKQGETNEDMTNDERFFDYKDMMSALAFSTFRCFKKHPTIRELNLLACDSHHEKWPELFFRLERYHVYRGVVGTTPWYSLISTYVHKHHRPTKPRIAPPE